MEADCVLVVAVIDARIVAVIGAGIVAVIDVGIVVVLDVGIIVVVPLLHFMPASASFTLVAVVRFGDFGILVGNVHIPVGVDAFNFGVAFGMVTFRVLASLNDNSRGLAANSIARENRRITCRMAFLVVLLGFEYAAER